MCLRMGGAAVRKVKVWQRHSGKWTGNEAKDGKAALQPSGAGGDDVLSVSPTCSTGLSFWATLHIPDTGEKPKAGTLQNR